MYSVFLEEWLRVFPRDQILVVRAEDYFKDRTPTLNTIFNFLGLGRCSPYLKYLHLNKHIIETL